MLNGRVSRAAGLLLGLGLGCSALFIALTPEMAGAARAQLAMWLVPPVWLTVLGVSFLFRSGPRAWLVLGGLNLLVLLQAALVPR